MKYKVDKITRGGIFFTNGASITDYHAQDWCEHVYASWRDGLKDTGFENKEFDSIEIEMVEDFGIRVNGYGVACYNEQNGYYSNLLSIIFTDEDGEETEYDATGYVQNNIW